MWICPTYGLQELKGSKLNKQLWFERHIAAALQLKKRPWKQVPDYKEQVKLIYDPEEAADIISDRTRSAELMAFDYETNRLKPDHPQTEIVSCSFCWDGEYTIAFPWKKKVRRAVRAALKSDVGVIASNMKFEERWTMAHLNIKVNNWVWDTMLAAHILDGRRSITSIKFQSFVQLGFESYDNHIKPYLEADSAEKFNNIRDLDLKSLLVYNGLDSLLEYLVAVKQMKQLASPLF